MAIASTYDVSPDGKQLVFSSLDATGKSRLWTAWLDRHSPPHKFESDLSENFPVFGPTGDLYYQAQEGTSAFLYHRPQNGGAGKRVASHRVMVLETISPDGKWLVAETPISGEDTVRGVQAFNVDDGAMKRICYSLCVVRWSENRKFVYIGLPGNSSNTARFKTFIVPVRHGSVFPDLPVNGIRSEADLEAITGVKMVEESLFPGHDDSHYAFDRNSDHRNIYRIPIPN
jgi:Tol biopolymer transport system component